MGERKSTIRTARLSDAPSLSGIYAPYVRETAITFEYIPPTEGEFADRMRTVLARYPYLVAELDGVPAGYAYAGVFKGRPAYDWAVETSIYVDRAHVRTGMGRALHDALEASLRAMGILNMYACIAVPDGPDDELLTHNSQQFHEHLGYRLVGEFYRCGLKAGRWYNMVWMEKMLGEHRPDCGSPRTFGEVREGLVEAGILAS